MSTSWQPLTWLIFHTLALNYNDTYREHYIAFFNTFKVIIPCSICRGHYNQHINKEHMIIEKNMNKDRIFEWTVDLHNSVNRTHKKKIWSYEEARNFYNAYNFNNKLFKTFLYEYIKLNYKKTPEKTSQLLIMMKTLPYLHPNEIKRSKLIEFKEKFELKRDNFKNWLVAFVLILKN